MPHPAPLRLLTSAGRFDRSAIMLAVHAGARRRIDRAAEIGCPKPMRYAVAFREAAADVWASARLYRQHFVRDVALAALPAGHVQLLDARTAALMIDSTRRMVVELAAINARAAALGSGCEALSPLLRRVGRRPWPVEADHDPRKAVRSRHWWTVRCPGLAVDVVRLKGSQS